MLKERIEPNEKMEERKDGYQRMEDGEDARRDGKMGDWLTRATMAGWTAVDVDGMRWWLFSFSIIMLIFTSVILIILSARDHLDLCHQCA
jgi:hypothetical protein